MSASRLDWIHQRVCELFGITDDAVFYEFLERDGGKFKDEILHYMSQTWDGAEIALLFYKLGREEEERIEVEITEADLLEPEPEAEPEMDETGRSLSAAPTATTERTADLLSAKPSDSAISTAMSDMKAKKVKGRKPKGGKKKAEEEAKRAEEAKAAAEAELQKQLQEEEEEEEEETEGPRTKIIINKVWREYLYMISGTDITFELIAQTTCVVFLRTQDGSIAEPRDKDPLAINRYMNSHFEVVMLNGDGLALLEDMLVEVYTPLLSFFEHRMSYVPSTEAVADALSGQKSSKPPSSRSSGSEGKASASASTSTGAVFTMLRDEFMHQLYKFKNSIGVVKEHLDARVHLDVPSHLHLDDTLEDSLANVELQQMIEEVCITWFKQVSRFYYSITFL